MIAKIKSIEDIIDHAESCKSDARRDARIFLITSAAYWLWRTASPCDGCACSICAAFLGSRPTRWVRSLWRRA